MQYGARFFGAVLSAKSKSKEMQETGAKLTKFSSTMSDGRKLFRLWKSLPEVPKLAQLLRAKDSPLNIGLAAARV